MASEGPQEEPPRPYPDLGLAASGLGGTGVCCLSPPGSPRLKEKHHMIISIDKQKLNIPVIFYN